MSITIKPPSSGDFPSMQGRYLKLNGGESLLEEILHLLSDFFFLLFLFSFEVGSTMLDPASVGFHVVFQFDWVGKTRLFTLKGNQ